MNDRNGREIKVNDIAMALYVDKWHLVRVTKVTGWDGHVEVTASGMSRWNPISDSVIVIDVDTVPAKVTEADEIPPAVAK